MHSCANFHKGKIVVSNARQQFHVFLHGLFFWPREW
jgi:hypothetical protein